MHAVAAVGGKDVGALICSVREKTVFDQYGRQLAFELHEWDLHLKLVSAKVQIITRVGLYCRKRLCFYFAFRRSRF